LEEEIGQMQMESQSQDEKLIARYLLGELTEDEQTELEERAFSDRDYFQQVRAVEKDLIDEYTRGELSGPALQSFERRFAASDSRRRQIGFARAFTQVAGEDPGPTSSDLAPAAQATWSNSFLLFWRGSNLAFKFSLAAVALIIIISGFWLLIGSRGSNQSHLERAGTQPSPQGTPQSQGSASPQPTTDQSAHNGVPTPLPQGSPPASPQQQVIASLLLLPGTARGAENLAQLNIQPATTAVQLRISIDKGEPYNHFRAELRTTAGKVIASQTNLTAPPTRARRTIVWLVPAGHLNSGEYELSLSGTTAQGQAEAVGYYYFKVLKK
jgi:hypothetical protein